MGCAAGGRSSRQVTLGAWGPPCIARRSSCLLQCVCLDDLCRTAPILPPLCCRAAAAAARHAGGDAPCAAHERDAGLPVWRQLQQGECGTRPCRCCLCPSWPCFERVADDPAVAASTYLLPSQRHSALPDTLQSPLMPSAPPCSAAAYPRDTQLHAAGATRGGARRGGTAPAG